MNENRYEVAEWVINEIFDVEVLEKLTPDQKTLLTVRINDFLKGLQERVSEWVLGR